MMARRRTRARRSLAIVCGAALLLGCASDGSGPHPNLARAWRSYQELPAQRALAIAGDPRGNRWVTGASGGHDSLAGSEEAAVSVCRTRRAARRMRAACVIYAVGDEIVWTDR
jgi:hypothetical protein